MSTVIRNEISKKNRYYISKHRMLELKHFCLQYEEWRQEYVRLTVLQGYGYGHIPGSNRPDPSSKIAMRAAELDGYMKMVMKCCKEADKSIWTYIFEAVTCGLSYGALVSRGIPCGKDYYYERYRKFFWLLDKVR